MKEHFKSKKFTPASVKLIERCNGIVEDYARQRLRLTLRQLYYQLVVANVITNAERSYKNLSSLVSDARIAGLVDWDAIEDRVRVPRAPREFKNLKEVVDAALWSYRLPRWRGQKNYVELWVEKDAIANVLSPIAVEFHITLMVNRGYSSQSAMYEASKRFLRRAEHGKKLHLLYLGDLDPSGEDMVRDIGARLQMFGVEDLTVTKVALTMDQVREHKPPPNPAKKTDPRAQAFIERFGGSSWEVDALPPQVLSKIIRGSIEGLLDRPKMDAVIAKERKDRERLERAVQRIMNPAPKPPPAPAASST